MPILTATAFTERLALADQIIHALTDAGAAATGVSVNTTGAHQITVHLAGPLTAASILSLADAIGDDAHDPYPDSEAEVNVYAACRGDDLLVLLFAGRAA